MLPNVVLKGMGSQINSWLPPHWLLNLSPLCLSFYLLFVWFVCSLNLVKKSGLNTRSSLKYIPLNESIAATNYQYLNRMGVSHSSHRLS